MGRHFTGAPTTDTAILRCCKRIHNEASGMLFEAALFTVHIGFFGAQVSLLAPETRLSWWATNTFLKRIRRVHLRAALTSIYKTGSTFRSGAPVQLTDNVLEVLMSSGKVRIYDLTIHWRDETKGSADPVADTIRLRLNGHGGVKVDFTLWAREHPDALSAACCERLMEGIGGEEVIYWKSDVCGMTGQARKTKR